MSISHYPLGWRSSPFSQRYFPSVSICRPSSCPLVCFLSINWMRRSELTHRICKNRTISDCSTDYVHFCSRLSFVCQLRRLRLLVPIVELFNETNGFCCSVTWHSSCVRSSCRFHPCASAKILLRSQFNENCRLS